MSESEKMGGYWCSYPDCTSRATGAAMYGITDHDGKPIYSCSVHFLAFRERASELKRKQKQKRRTR